MLSSVILIERYPLTNERKIYVINVDIHFNEEPGDQSNTATYLQYALISNSDCISLILLCFAE